MAKVKQKASLADRLNKYNAQDVHEEHKGDEIEYGKGGGLPEGIEAGIAKLISIEFGEYPDGDFAGETYFTATGVVVSPEEHEGRPIKGLQTRIPWEPLCNTPNKEGERARRTFEDHYWFVLNELKKLGKNPEDGTNVFEEVSFEELEDTANALVESEVYFAFRTWKGKPTKAYPNPKVKEEWQGAVEYTPDDESSTAVQDNSAAKSNGKTNTVQMSKGSSTKKTTPATSTNGATAKGAATKKKAVPAKKSLDDMDLDEVGALATSKDEEAQTFLTNKAIEAGYDEDTVNNAPDWASVIEMINNPNTNDGGDTGVDYASLGTDADKEQGKGNEGEACARLRAIADEEGLDPDDYGTWSELAQALAEKSESGDSSDGAAAEDGWPPVEGLVFKYKAKTMKKPEEMEVTKVYAKVEKVDLKCISDDKPYKGVPFDDLIRE